MSDRGHFILPRSLLQEPLLQNPFYGYAFVWLLSEAAWRPRDVEVSSGRATAVIRLERGQLTYSIRYMAKAWGVTEKRVRTILNRLENGSWIGTQAGTLQTVITICNYDRLQSYDDDRGTQTGTQTGTPKARHGHKTNHSTIKPEERGIVIKAPELKPEDYTDDEWLKRLRHFEQNDHWPQQWGPKPGDPKCLVPSRLFMKAVSQTSPSR